MSTHGRIEDFNIKDQFTDQLYIKRSQLYKKLEHDCRLPSSYRGKTVGNIETARNLAGMITFSAIAVALIYTMAFAIATHGFKEFSGKIATFMGVSYGVTGVAFVTGAATGVLLEVHRRKKMNEEINQDTAEKEITEIRAALQQEYKWLTRAAEQSANASKRYFDRAEIVNQQFEAIRDPA